MALHQILGIPGLVVLTAAIPSTTFYLLCSPDPYIFLLEWLGLQQVIYDSFSKLFTLV